MLELPETHVLSAQADQTLTGKKVVKVYPPSSPHKFTWFNGSPEDYNALFAGRTVEGAKSLAAYMQLDFDGGAALAVRDGVNVRYLAEGEVRPDKYQLLIEFAGGEGAAFTVAMYGGILGFKEKMENSYYEVAANSVSPLSPEFTEEYFLRIVRGVKRDLSVKALLATEQRIPGLGNGVLQDILFHAGLHPKRKASTLTDRDLAALYETTTAVLDDMAARGGRDTERDLFGRSGGYRCVLSKKTVTEPCMNCGGDIVKEAYLGGAVYYCPVCQPLK